MHEQQDKVMNTSALYHVPHPSQGRHPTGLQDLDQHVHCLHKLDRDLNMDVTSSPGTHANPATTANTSATRKKTLGILVYKIQVCEIALGLLCQAGSKAVWDKLRCVLAIARKWKGYPAGM